MAARWPFTDTDTMFKEADAIWRGLAPSDWLEAFRAHPKIGERTSSQWSKQEQSGAVPASSEQRAELDRLNCEYERRFGYLFIICATGKTIEQILQALRERSGNAPEVEIQIAAEEQRQITRLRLLKLTSH